MNPDAVPNPKKIIGIWFLVFFLLLSFIAVALLAFLIRTGSVEIPHNPFGKKTYLPEFPVFTGAYSLIGQGDTKWQIDYFQPVIEEFVTTDSANYLRVSYELNPKEKKEVLIFVSGKTDPGFVENVTFGTLQENEQVDFETLSSRLNVGSQVRLGYLATVPSKETRTFEFCTDIQELCNLANVFEKNADRVKRFSTSQTVVPGLVLPGYFIFTDLENPSEFDIRNYLPMEKNTQLDNE